MLKNTVKQTCKVGKMKVAVVPKKPCKQIMRNLFLQLESRRQLTANVGNKWISNIHKNVNSASFNTYETLNKCLAIYMKNPRLHEESQI